MVTRSHSRGFTLVELIVVVLILGVLAATALPRFIELSGRSEVASLEAAKGVLVSAANLIQSRAQLQDMGPGVNGEIDGVWSDNGYPVFMNFPNTDTDPRPEILEMANIHDDRWVYHHSGTTRAVDGSGTLLVTLKSVIAAPANLAAIQATNCYLSYVQYWAGHLPNDPINHKLPEVTVVSNGCT